MAQIRVEKITRSFGASKALDSVSLEVKDQEFAVLLGPSGCGKTTLLRIIAGLETKDSGEVWIGEREVSGLPPRSRGLAMVFQNYAIFPHLTVYENIAFGLRMKKTDTNKIKTQVEKSAALMHIEAYLQRSPAQLSGGQRQRVAVARALAVEPEVLLMDEPLSNLDALLRLEMRAELKKLLRETKTTTIYVTHDQVEAMSLADRIAVMKSGNLEQYDLPMQVYQNPSSTFVGSFIGNPPMNFLRLPLESGQAKLGVALYPTKATGQAVVLGMRPEDLELCEPTDLHGFAVEVSVVEQLGPHGLVTGTYGEQLVKVITPPDYLVRLNAPMYVRPNLARMRFMDATTGRSL
jgi:multiple sugar transport system ATP-binding protein